jgi:hypothetical protein
VGAGGVAVTTTHLRNCLPIQLPNPAPQPQRHRTPAPILQPLLLDRRAATGHAHPTLLLLPAANLQRLNRDNRRVAGRVPPLQHPTPEREGNAFGEYGGRAAHGRGEGEGAGRGRGEWQADDGQSVLWRGQAAGGGQEGGLSGGGLLGGRRAAQRVFNILITATLLLICRCTIICSVQIQLFFLLFN